MLVLSPIKIDLRKQTLREAVYAVQNDSNTRGLELTLVEGESPWNIPVDTAAAISFRKPDGTSGLYDTLPDGVTKAVEITQNKVTAIFAPQVLTCPGRVDVSLILFDSLMNRLGTFPIPVFVSEDPSAGQGISNDYYNFQTLAELNEAIGGHIHDNSNPHGVTAAQVGAAPAGYGLGEETAKRSTINDMLKNGFYYGTITEPATGYSGNTYGVHVQYSDSYAYQELIGMKASTGITEGTVRRRYKDNGTWSEIEYVNPPMVPGVEYRTTERFNGEVVYTRLLTITPVYPYANVNFDYVKDLVRTSIRWGNMALPYYDSGGSPMMWWQTSHEWIYIYTQNESVANGTVYAQIWYTK